MWSDGWCADHVGFVVSVAMIPHATTKSRTFFPSYSFRGNTHDSTAATVSLQPKVVRRVTAGRRHTPGRVIGSYYAVAGLYTLSAAMIWGVNTLFLLDAGLDIFGVFLANGAFTAGMVVFEIPTGVLADTRGRRVSFLLSVGILIFTTVAYVAVARSGGNLLAFVGASVVMGLGFTFYSGAVEPWLVDALRETGFAGRLDSVFARGAMVTGAAMLVGTVSGGLLGSVDLALRYSLP